MKPLEKKCWTGIGINLVFTAALIAVKFKIGKDLEQ